MERATGERMSALEGTGDLDPGRETPSEVAQFYAELIPDAGAGMDRSTVPVSGIKAETAVETRTGWQKELTGMGMGL